MNAQAEITELDPPYLTGALFQESGPAATMQQLIDDLPEEIALLDEDCTIVAVNRAWRETCMEHGYRNNGPGYNYRAFCAAKAAEGYGPALKALAGLTEIASGKRNSWELDYNGENLWAGRDYQISIRRIAIGGQALISVTRYDVTELVGLRRLKDDFTNSRTGLSDALKTLVEGFSEQVAVVDEQWTILAVNGAWTEVMPVVDHPDLTPGTNYRDFLTTLVGKSHATAMAVHGGIEAIERGESNSYELTYAGADHWEGRTLHLRINRLRIDGRMLATITRDDITDRAELRRLREDFNSSVLEGQAEERRRLGRELHDTASQLLACLGLTLGQLKRDLTQGDHVDLLDEMEQLLSDTHKEIRSLSYLARPPALGPGGLANALEALVEGFGRRTEIGISLEIDGPPISCAAHVEGALYRVAQEAIANIHRHAHAKQVSVWLSSRNAMMHLLVADDGIGISGEALAGRGRPGVGLAGMRARLEEIGGRLTVHRLSPGTAIIASVPHLIAEA
jgi:signal transduction histidine kinase